MKKLTIVALSLLSATTLALAADSTRQARLAISTGGVVNIANNGGSVTLRQGNQRQVLVTITTHSDKIEVDTNSTPDGRRVDIRSHTVAQQRPSAEECRVEFEVAVPAGASVA